ncbi:MAG: lytic transglycosylase domain-containing protein [Desulfobacterales bacterium]|nr:lytic transglycosylase domain-containing protein [Desulfobacterales bacterium]
MARKTRLRVIQFLLVAYGLALLMAPIPVRGDIYCYVDNKGSLHFSNVPTSPRYRIYRREDFAGQGRYRSSRYDRYISEAARTYGMPFSLIKAIIKVESNFDPNAVSSSGARGLMQIMPDTAKGLGVTDTFDPRENIFGGARYLKALLTRFEGNLPLALAAYNAGPNKVDYLKRMPRIRETQHFVDTVLEHFNGYRLSRWKPL